MEGILLAVENVTKRYGPVEALRGLSLEVKRGEFFGLLGPNGAGKSTLMHILSGLIGQDSGTVRIGGEDSAIASRTLGLVPQEIALYQELSAWQNIQIFGELNGLSSADARKRGEALLAMVNLSERAQDKVKQWSGGMKRRLNIILSLLHEPALLLCDEPTVGVDPQSRNAIFEFLEQLNKDGLTIIYTTHYMEEVERLCSRIGIIDGGRLCACGTRSELLAAGQVGMGEVRLHECAQAGALAALLAQFGEVTEVANYIRFSPAAGCGMAQLAAAVEQSGYPAHMLEIRRPSLEQRFLELTGKELRE